MLPFLRYLFSSAGLRTRFFRTLASLLHSRAKVLHALAQGSTEVGEFARAKYRDDDQRDNDRLYLYLFLEMKLLPAVSQREQHRQDTRKKQREDERTNDLEEQNPNCDDRA